MLIKVTNKLKKTNNMNQFKRAQIIMLQSVIKSHILLYHNPNGAITLKRYTSALLSNEIRYAKHLYVISNDEIKEGDWIYEDEFKTISVAKYNNSVLDEKFKKIITTTDTSLEIISKGINPVYEKLPQPSQQFIKKYIESYNKGVVLSDILVEYEQKYETMYKGQIGFPEDDVNWWINKIKINPKDNTINIKPLKDSWNKEEIINLIKSFANNYQYASNNIGYNKWIEENL
jgi:hypothetical protein